MATERQEIRYIRSCMTEEEIERKTGELDHAERCKPIVRWDDGPMTPEQLMLWAEFAKNLGAVSVDSYAIYRLATPAEMENTVIYREWQLRKFTKKDIPENLEELELAGKTPGE